MLSSLSRVSPWMERLSVLSLAAVMALGVARDAEADASGWLGVRAGLGLGENLVIARTGGEFEAAGTPSFSLGITGFFSLGMVEIGANLELSSAAGTSTAGEDGRLFAQLRAVGLLRWHFVADTWGGLFMGLGAGLSATRLSESLRLELARPGAGTRDSVEASPLGLAIEVELGAAFALNDGLRMGIVLAIHATTGALSIKESSFDFLTTQTQLHMGLEWAL